MGKAKKGKKDRRDDESDEEMEIETKAGDAKLGSGKEKKVKLKAKDDQLEDDDDVSTKKTRSKKEKKEGDSVDDLDELVKPSDKGKNKKQPKKAAGSSDEEDHQRLMKAPKSKKKAKVDSDSDGEDVNSSKQGKSKMGFALLMDDDESQSDLEVQSNSEDDSQAKPVKKKAVKGSSVEKEVNGEDKLASKKGKKGKKKKQDDDEEDIDRMLAELELEYSGGKKEVVNEDIKVETVSKKVKTRGKDSISITDSIAPDEPKKEVVDGEELDSTVKSAAQKKKEKKEREKLKKQTQKKHEVGKRTDSIEEHSIEQEVSAETIVKKEMSAEPTVEKEEAGVSTEDLDDGSDKKKSKKKKGKDAEEGKEKVKGPNKKMIAAMQEALKKAKEEEEKFARDEEERIRRLEDSDRAKEEAARLDQERKEKRKLRERERKEQLRSEGKLLTSKQKADRARAQAMLDSLKAQGLDLPNVGEKKAPRPSTRVRGKLKPQAAELPADNEKTDEEQKIELEIVDKTEEKEEAKEEEGEEEAEGVKDAWDAESSEEEDTSEQPKITDTVAKPESKPTAKSKAKPESEDDDDDDDDSSEDESNDSCETEDHRTDAEKKREKALLRIRNRREDAEASKTLENLRAAVVCVLGHVDTGKTKILDKLRRTNVQDGEAGGITQQIGATNVPIDNIREQTKIVRGFADYEMKIPGLLIIDTPGHESFSNLRSRGSSLCDIAILVVDIMHGIEPQTLESINLLKMKKTPFVVALNKIDRLYDWQTMARKDIRDVLKAQAGNTLLEFEQRTKEVIVQFAEQGLNASLFYENPDTRSYVSLVPTSAITGEGISNLLALIVDNCQNLLAKRLMYSDELQATVLEVKAISGLGTTIDAILINGKLREGDTMILAGTDGPIVTQIRSLLMPQPMKELRVKNAYVEYKEIKAAQGVKIAAKDLEKAIAGLNLQVAQKPDEVEILREEVAKELRHALSNIKLQDRGVYVQASTLGSLEALLEFLKTSKIPYSNIRIGPVVKKDVMKASTMLEHDGQYATILAFDVKIEKDAQEMADTLGVKIFQADIIYHLFDKFMAYRDELKQRKREEFKHIAVFPCKLKILPQFIFNSRDPIVMGVMVEAGIVREGTPICVPSREFVEVGVVRSIENNKKNVETARKGQEVCIKIEAIPGEAPKMYGRHFDENDFLVSKISRQSIDACKDYFREDLVKADWELMVELKKQFEIL